MRTTLDIMSPFKVWRIEEQVKVVACLRNHLYLLNGRIAFIERCVPVCGHGEIAGKVPPSHTEWLASTRIGRSGSLA